LVVSLYADAKFYVGTDYGIFKESMSGNTSAYSESGISTLKLGYADRETYGIEFSLDYTKNKSNIFSADDGDRFGLNINLLKAFDYNIYILPYIKAGIGAGFLSIDRAVDDKLYYSSYNIGTGVLLPVNENFDFEIGYDYKYTSYESINMVSEKLLFSSHINVVYAGFNIRY
jgi:opacity protein-like surface antigen